MRHGIAITLLLLLLLSGGCSSDTNRLKENIDTLQVSITLGPFNPYRPDQKDPGGGLRSVLLYTSSTLRIEPDGMWPDGSPASAAAKLTEQEMLGVIEELERSGLLKNAEHYYSAAVANPRSRRPTGSNRDAYKPAYPSCIITAIYTRDDYHHYVVCTVPWGKDTLAVLKRLKAHIPTSLAEELIHTYERFGRVHEAESSTPRPA
jgi:hypothetical protein